MNGECKLQSAKCKTAPWERDAIIEDKSGKHREEKHQNLRDRFLQLGIRMIRTGMALPENEVGRVVRGQIIRSGTSAGANYEEASAAESRTDFIHKMQIVLKELRETRYWLRLILAVQLLPETRLAGVCAEADELISITVKSLKTARGAFHVAKS
jgi:four helix bundle protein